MDKDDETYSLIEVFGVVFMIWGFLTAELWDSTFIFIIGLLMNIIAFIKIKEKKKT